MNWSEFFAMNGYGFYVWGSYGVALLVFAVEIAMVRHRRKLALRQLKWMNESGDAQ
jgi:heme exporter protein D